MLLERLLVRRPAQAARRVCGTGPDAWRPAVSSDGTSALIAASPGDVVLWDTCRAEPLRTIRCSTGEHDRYHRVALAADGLIGAFARQYHDEVSFWDLTSGRPFEQLTLGSGGHFTALSLTSNGQHFAGIRGNWKGGTDVVVLDLRDPSRPRSRELKAGTKLHLPDGIGASMSEDGRRVVVPVQGGHALWVWDLADDAARLHELPEEVMNAPLPEGFFNHDPYIWPRAAITADGRRAFTGSTFGRLIAWDPDEGGSGRLMSQLRAVFDDILSVADGALVISVSSVTMHQSEAATEPHGWLQIHDVEGGGVVSELLWSDYDVDPSAHGVSAVRLAASADGRTMVLTGASTLFIELKNYSVTT
jgi:hypothetical protein